MTHDEQKAILGGAPDLALLYQYVLLKRVALDSTATALTDRNQRQSAYEMAMIRGQNGSPA